MFKKAIIYVIVFGIIGFVIGYFLYGKVAGEYMDPFKLILPSKDVLHKFGRSVSGIQGIRENIFMFGGIGAVIGLGITIFRKK